MRKFSLFLLLASSAVPALASPDDNDRSRRQKADKTEQSEARSQRSESRAEERATRQRARAADETQERVPGARRVDGVQRDNQGTSERSRERVLERQQADSARTGAGDSVRRWRSGDRDNASEGSTLRRRERQVRTIPDTQPSATTQGRRGGIARAYDGRQRRDYRDGNYRRWSDNWRNDRRYDWRRWRDRNRSLFRLGFYYDPFGWSYRRWSIGSFLFPSYYGSRYHLNDPWRYRLPPAYGPYRWVRYWDDALLVNIYTGEVVEVMHNFFW